MRWLFQVFDYLGWNETTMRQPDAMGAMSTLSFACTVSAVFASIVFGILELFWHVHITWVG